MSTRPGSGPITWPSAPIVSRLPTGARWAAYFLARWPAEPRRSLYYHRSVRGDRRVIWRAGLVRRVEFGDFRHQLVLDMSPQLGYGRIGKQLARLERNLVFVPDSRQELQRKQRMAAKFEEIVVDANRRDHQE